MTTLIDLYGLKEEIMQIGEVVAIATVKQINPAFDEIKYQEACKIAGSERWLRFHLKKGNLKPIRRGTATNSPIYYSRYEIAALRHAEKRLEAKFA